MPYPKDLGRAFAGLRREVFESHDYCWAGEDEGEPWPSTEEVLWEDEDLQETGTHSTLDVVRVIGAEDRADAGHCGQ
ncbi:hypothetical protein [Streptomyces sp. NPDC008141]|uniref:hypothetical protein n=1 Tax=Streptomyces sp. NPDC008141 TaxID=3364815 RepID=UPI0036E13E2B